MSNPTPKPIVEVKTERQIAIARFSADGRILVAGGFDALFRRWRLEGEKDFVPLPAIEGHHGWTGALAFHPREPWLFTADSWGQLRCSIVSDETVKTLWRHEQAHDGWIRQVAVSPDGALLATCGSDRFLRLWKTATGEAVSAQALAEDLYALAFHPTEPVIVTGDSRGQIHAWNYDAKKFVRTFDAPVFYKLDRIQDIGGLRVLAFLSGGKDLLAGGTTPKNGATMLSTPTLLTFDFAEGKLVHTFTHGKPEHGFIHDLALHPAGYLIAVTSGSPGSGLVLMLKPREAAPFFEDTKLPNCHSVALHPDGKHFLVTSTNRDSNGNGRKLGKDGEYQSNSSPLHWMEIAS